MTQPSEVSSTLLVARPVRRARRTGLLLFALSALLYAAFGVSFPVDPMFSVLNYAIAISSLALIFLYDRAPTSLLQVFLLCCVIFFAIAPRIELSTGTVYWMGSSSVFRFYDITAILALIGLWVFALAFAVGKRTHLVIGRRRTALREPPAISGPRLILLSMLTVGLIYYVNNFSIISVFFRATVGDVGVQLPSSVNLVYANALRALPTVCFVIYMLLGPRRVLVALVLLLLMLIGNPITGFARWQGGMLYLAALLAAVRPLLRMPYFVTITLFLGLFLVFPLLDAFRRFSETVRLRFSLDWIYRGNLDSFQNFARVVEFDIVTYGNQLLGVILFWVPRIFWSDKPVQSGREISEVANLGLDNIALNFLGEGYINFGVLGVVIFAAMLGFCCGQLDRAFWKDQRFSLSFQTFYIFFLGGIVFVFRGSLLSAFAYMIGTYASVLLALWLADTNWFRFRVRNPYR